MEEKYNLKHSNNLRLRRWSIHRGGQVREGVGVEGLTIFEISIYYINLTLKSTAIRDGAGSVSLSKLRTRVVSNLLYSST